MRGEAHANQASGLIMVIMLVRTVEAIEALYGKLGSERDRESILRAEECVCVRRLDVCVCDYMFAACSCLLIMKHRCLLTTWLHSNPVFP